MALIAAVAINDVPLDLVLTDGKEYEICASRTICCWSMRISLEGRWVQKLSQLHFIAQL